MVLFREGYPFFCSIESELEEINYSQETAKTKLIARNAVFYNKTMFRAFLMYSGKELEDMTLQEYMDCQIMLPEVLRIIHAPFQNNE